MAKKKMTLEEKLEEIIVEDVPYEVNDNWIWSKLGVICSFIDYRGKTPKKTESGVRLITAKNIKKGYISLEPEEFIAELDYDGWMTRGIPKYGDVIFTTEAPLGNVAQLFLREKYALAQRAIVLSIIDGMIQEYLKFVLLSPSIQEIINQMATGTTVKGIKASRLKELPIPVPPLKEQQRIVDKIKSLFKKLDKAKELIEEVRVNFEKRKKTLIAKGVSGKLINKSFDNEVCINDIIVDINSGFACSKQYEMSKDQEGAYPHLRPNNVGYYNKFNFNKIVYIPIEKVQEGKGVIKKGEIIFNNTNSTELVGRAVVATQDMEVAFSNHLTKLIVDTNKVLPEWVAYCINALWGKGFFTQICKRWVGQSGVNQNVLRKEVIIPLPSLEDQKEVVKILDKLLEEEAKIEEITAIEEQIELIKKSVLAKAFRGQLGTNCEEDESVLELLKEILNT